jgi:hypothetical protein
LYFFSTQWLRYRLKRDYGDSIQIHKSLSGKVSDLVTRTESELSSLITDDQLCGCVTCENRKATEDQPTDGEESDEQDD